MDKKTIKGCKLYRRLRLFGMRYVIPLILFFVLACPGFATEERVEVHGVSLVRKGSGVLKYKRLISVYDATLYLPEGVKASEALNDVAKRISVAYRVDARQSRFHKAGYRVLQKAYPEQQIAQIQERLDRLNGWYDDARKGEGCAISYLPGKGTLLTVNDEERGWIPGADFARMYFSIWLGDPCASASLRKALLHEK